MSKHTERFTIVREDATLAEGRYLLSGDEYTALADWPTLVAGLSQVRVPVPPAARPEAYLLLVSHPYQGMPIGDVTVAPWDFGHFALPTGRHLIVGEWGGAGEGVVFDLETGVVAEGQPLTYSDLAALLSHPSATLRTYVQTQVLPTLPPLQ